ncbi:MAG: hypothetical protein FWD68_08695 [Alphaproteobacteria bacterium]|nr:hypothetical protein [Alphaproteobacteria bacterium]
MIPLVVPTVCYNLETVSHFFRTAASAVAVNLTTRIEWVEDRDSKFLNALYTVFFWKGQPGFAEIRSGKPEDIDKFTNQYHDRFLSRWVEKLASHGPADAMKYYNAVVGIRDMAVRDGEETRRMAAEINDDAIGETNRFIRQLAGVKLAGRLGVVAMDVVGSKIPGPVGWGLKAGAVAGNVIFATIDNWNASDLARVVAIDPGVDRSAGGVALDEAAGRIGRRAQGLQGAALERAAEAERITRNAGVSAERYAQQLASRIRGQARIRGKTKGLATAMARRQEEIAAQTAARASALRTAQLAEATKDFAHHASSSISFIFAATDVMEAIHEYQETVEAAH